MPERPRPGQPVTWADVERRVAGEPVPDAVVRRSRRRRTIAIVGVLVAAVVVGVLIGRFGVPSTAATPSPARSDEGPLDVARVIVGGVLVLGAVALWITAFVRTARRGDLRVAWQEPTFGLARAERRAIERGLRGREPAEGTRIGTLRGLAARRLRQSVLSLAVFVGWTAMALGQLLIQDRALLTVAWSVVAVLAAVSTVVLLRIRSRWQAFLAAHPAEPPGPARPA